jgi:hypothetical protein
MSGSLSLPRRLLVARQGEGAEEEENVHEPHNELWGWLKSTLYGVLFNVH